MKNGAITLKKAYYHLMKIEQKNKIFGVKTTARSMRN